MKEVEKERVNQAFEHGANDFSKKDLDKVMGDAEIAESKAVNLANNLKTSSCYGLCLKITTMVNIPTLHGNLLQQSVLR